MCKGKRKTRATHACGNEITIAVPTKDVSWIGSDVTHAIRDLQICMRELQNICVSVFGGA